MTGPIPAATAFETIVESAARAAAAMVGEALAAFTAPSTGIDRVAVLGAHSALLPLLLAVLVAAVAVQAVRIVVQRRGEPLAVVASGLARFGLTTTLGLATLQAALVGGDALTAALPAGPAGGVGEIVASRLVARDGLTEPFLLLLVSVCVLVLAAGLWMALFARQVALLVIAAALPLAAAGSLTVATRGWLARLVPWGVALLLYKPAAALVLGLGAGVLSAPAAAQGVGAMLAGIAVLGLAVAVLPALLRLLTWSRVGFTGTARFTAPATPLAVGAVRSAGRVAPVPGGAPVSPVRGGVVAPRGIRLPAPARPPTRRPRATTIRPATEVTR